MQSTPCRAPIGRMAAILLSACSALSAQELAPSINGTHAIVGARIVVEPGTVIENGSVLMKDGLIQAVGRDLELPPGTRVLEAQGATVTAGFMVVGPTVAVPRPKAPEKPQTPRDRRRARGLHPDRHAAEGISAESLPGSRWLAQGVTSLLALPEGNGVPGLACLVSAGPGPRSERVLRDPVALLLTFRGGGSGYPRSLMGAVAALRQLFLDGRTAAERAALVAADPRGLGRPPYEPDLAPLGPVLSGERPALFTIRRAGDVRRACALGREFGLHVWVRGGRPLAEGADALSGSGAGAFIDLDPGKIVYAANEALAKGPDAPSSRPAKGPTEASDPDAAWVAFRRAERAAKEREKLVAWYGLGARLAAAGVPFGFAAAEPGRLLERVRSQVAWKLDPDAALDALTRSVARRLGVGNALGRVAPGYVADLAVFSADPFEKGRVTHVFSRGVRFDLPEKAAKGKQDTAQLAPLAGSWKADSPMGGGEATLRITVTADGVSGNLTTGFGELDVTSATREGDTYTISLAAERGEMSFSMEVTGKLSGDGRTFEGTLSMGERGDRPFKATKIDEEDQP